MLYLLYHFLLDKTITADGIPYLYEELSQMAVPLFKRNSHRKVSCKMNTKMSKRGVTALYIILVPVILLIILMNSGILQKTLTAVTVNGRKINAVEYNYYYYSMESQFMEEHGDELEELGFDQKISAKNQQTDHGISWWEYFCEQAERRICEVHYLNALAVNDAYSFSDEELSGAGKKISQAKQEAQQNKVSFENYLIACYGSGITEERWEELLLAEAKADAYLAHLQDGYEAEPSEIAAWIASNLTEDGYDTVNLSMITLCAGTDRETMEVTQRQMDALERRVTELRERYLASPDSFGELLAAFCDDEALVEKNGVSTDTLKEEIPEALADWCYAGGSQVGDAKAVVDAKVQKAYLAVYNGRGRSSNQVKASQALANEAVIGQMDAAVGGYTVERHFWGMKLIDRQ